MNFWLIPTILFTLAFVISFIREKRRFRNGIYLLFALICFYFHLCFVFWNDDRLYGFLSAVPIIIIPLASIIFSAVFIWAGITTMKREGLRPKNALALCAGIGIWLFYIFVIVTVSAYIKNIWVTYFMILLVFLFCYYIFAFVSFFFYSQLYTLLPKNVRCDYIIIHGAGLMGGDRVTPLLARRIDKAIALWEKGGRKARFIASGGKGADEDISEAAAMFKYMTEKDIPGSSILLEDRSTTTYENIYNSKELMDSDWTGEKKYKCIFVTNNYHVFRTGTYARKVGLKADGVGCRTALYYWPGAFIREYAALMVSYKWWSLPIIALWGILVAVSQLPD